MEITEVKNILGITSTVHDTYLETVVPLFSDFAKNYCHDDFTDENDIEVLPAGVKVFVAKACEFNMKKSGISSMSMGEVSYSYEIDFPPSIMKLLSPYRKVSFHD